MVPSIKLVHFKSQKNIFGHTKSIQLFYPGPVLPPRTRGAPFLIWLLLSFIWLDGVKIEKLMMTFN